MGCWKGVGAAATKGVALAVREVNVVERAALKRARRAFCWRRGRDRSLGGVTSAEWS